MNELTNELDEIVKIDSIDAEVDSSTTEEEEVGETGADQEEETEIISDKTKTQERFSKLTEHNRELKEQLDEMQAWKDEIEQERSQRTEQETKSQIPEWFSEVMGENEKAWEGFQGMTAQMKQEAIEAIKAEGTQERQLEEQSAQEGMAWVTDQMELVTEKFGTLSESKKNELMSVVEQYTPTDSEGNLDFIKGYELMQVLGKKTVDVAKKKLVDVDGSSHTVNTEDFKGKTYNY